MKSRLLITSFLLSLSLSTHSFPKSTSQNSESQKPSKLKSIPSKWKGRVGTSLAAPKYHFTKRPILIEGVQKTKELGYSIIKLFVPDSKINRDGQALDYFYNSAWRLNKKNSLKEILSHEYFKKSFSSGLKVFALDCVHSWEAFKHADPTVTEASIENEMYEAVKYLLSKYKTKDITFIIQNWEGDWMMRAAFVEWSKTGIPENWKKTADLLLKWVGARQKGVERARQEFKSAKCKVYHAIEVNKVFDGKKDIPTVASYILPQVKVDMVSWSAYDGIHHGVGDGALMNKGLKYLKGQIRPSQIRVYARKGTCPVVDFSS